MLRQRCIDDVADKLECFCSMFFKTVPHHILQHEMWNDRIKSIYSIKLLHFFIKKDLESTHNSQMYNYVKDKTIYIVSFLTDLYIC